MLHGLAISLLESTLVQSPLRLSACAHMHIHTRMRASSDARLAAARGLGAVTAGGHSIGTAAGHIVEHLPHGELIQTRISKCGGSSDDIALTSRTRGWLSDGACVHLLRRVPSRRSAVSSSLNAKGRDSLHKVDVPDRVLVCTACGTCSIFTGKPPKLPWKQSFEESRTV